MYDLEIIIQGRPMNETSEGKRKASYTYIINDAIRRNNDREKE